MLLVPILRERGKNKILLFCRQQYSSSDLQYVFIWLLSDFSSHLPPEEYSEAYAVQETKQDI